VLSLRKAAPLIAGLACAASAGLPTNSLASVHAHDATATRAYLRATDAYDHSATGEVAASVAATEARTSEIAGGCPSALTYAPRDEAFGELGEEAIMSALWAGAAPMRSTGLRLADAIAHLTWSDRRLTRLVHAEAAEERGIAAIALPDVCADIAAWKAGAYAALSQSSTQFLARVRAIETLSLDFGPSEATTWHLLRRFEGPAERPSARRMERAEAQIRKRLEAAAVAAEGKLAAGLGVSTL
jgi:hypothetical protein